MPNVGLSPEATYVLCPIQVTRHPLPSLSLGSFGGIKDVGTLPVSLCNTVGGTLSCRVIGGSAQDM